MHRYARFSLLAVVVLLFFASSGFAIQRTPARLNLIEFGGGYIAPQGSENGTVLGEFADGLTRFAPDANKIYKDGFALWFNFGQLYQGHWLWSVGFRYSQADFQDTVVARDVYFTYLAKPTLAQYDFDLNLNFMMANIRRSPFAPYIGAGFTAGVSGARAKGYESEYGAGITARVNFGADIKLWTSPDQRGIVALASVNSWDFVASGDRPKLLQIGGALKYYFRM